MLSLRLPLARSLAATARRSVVTTTTQKAAGDISSVFPSLSGVAPAPLHPRFATLKSQYLNGKENELQASWERLVEQLRVEVEEVKELGSKVTPLLLLNFDQQVHLLTGNGIGYPIN